MTHINKGFNRKGYRSFKMGDVYKRVDYGRKLTFKMTFWNPISEHEFLCTKSLCVD
jgi:hypothetical protein